MTVIADPEFWLRLFSIGVLNLLLSGDNALVIALAVRALPARKRIVGQLWGAIGAVVFRLVFVAIVSVLLRVPLLQLLGGLLLVWIAVRLVRADPAGASDVRHGASLWEAGSAGSPAPCTIRCRSSSASWSPRAAGGSRGGTATGSGCPRTCESPGSAEARAADRAEREAGDGGRPDQVHAHLRGDRPPGQADDRRGAAQERRPAPARARPRREVRRQSYLGP